MRQKIKFTQDVIVQLNDFYLDLKLESISVLYFKETSESYLGCDLEIPAYAHSKVRSETAVSLAPEYLKRCIRKTVSDYQGFFLIHNHNVGKALLSSDDRMADAKMRRYLKSRRLDILYGTAVYANGRISYRTNRLLPDLCWNRKLVNMQE